MQSNILAPPAAEILGVSAFVASAFQLSQSQSYELLAANRERTYQRIQEIEALMIQAGKLLDALPAGCKGLDIDLVNSELFDLIRRRRRDLGRLELAGAIRLGQIDGDWNLACKSAVECFKDRLIDLGLNDADLKC